MQDPRKTGPVLLDRAEILRRLDHAAGIAAVRESLIAFSAGQVQQPPVVYMGFDRANGDCHVKCAHVSGTPVFVVKIATGFYENPAKGLPSSNGLIVALSATTGETAALQSCRRDGSVTVLPARRKRYGRAGERPALRLRI